MSLILHSYGNEFTTTSANEVLPYVFKIIGVPEKVIDIGCGIGTWLKVCKNYSVSQVVGLDGQHVLESGQLMLDITEFIPTNLETISCNSNTDFYDLAICLEVVEHLEASKSQEIVDYLCKCSNIILFSAAIPGQTGENHLNEQYPQYWQTLFEKNGFSFYDIRDKFWDNHAVEWWYRQNIFIVAKNSSTNISAPKWNGYTYIIRDMLDQYVSALGSRNQPDIGSLLSKYTEQSPFRLRLHKIILKFKSITRFLS